MWVGFFLKIYMKQFPLLEVLNDIISKMYRDGPVKHPLLLSDVHNIWASSRFERKMEERFWKQLRSWESNEAYIF